MNNSINFKHSDEKGGNMKCKTKKLHPVFLITLLMLIFTKSAYAYLDPGTGSFIIQTLIVFSIAIAATAKIWWYKIKGLFRGNSEKRTGENQE